MTVYYELTIMSYSMLEETIITLSGWAPAIIQSSQFINYNSMCILRSLPFNNLFFFNQLRISVWSLVSKSVSYIKYPKHANAGKYCPMYVHLSSKFFTKFWSSLQCRRFLRTRECFCSRKHNVETPKEKRKWGESGAPTLRFAISTLPNLPLS